MLQFENDKLHFAAKVTEITTLIAHLQNYESFCLENILFKFLNIHHNMSF